MRRLVLSALTAAAAVAGASSDPASAQSLTTELVANGFDDPLLVTTPVGDPRLFVVEKSGRIQIIENGAVLPTPFLNLSGVVNGASEQGLLGLAFSPNYAVDGEFFVSYTTNQGGSRSRIERYNVSANPDVADSSSGVTVLEVTQPFSNHNGGMIAFDRDGYLLIGFGDGGSANDPGCRSQDLTTWLGKLLRIDVSQGLPYMIPADNPFVGAGSALPEIYHLGLRNPWRFSIDALTGDVYIGDVGQNNNEEISFYAYGQGGLNYGWKVMESVRCNSSSSCPGGTPACMDPAYTLPIFDLPQTGFGGPLSITGGYVYRGTAMPDLQGTYFFTDYIDDRIRTFRYDTVNGVQDFMDRTAELAPGGGLNLRSIASFGEDSEGELYICDLSGGEVFKIVPDVPDDPLVVSGVTPDPLDSLVVGPGQVVTISGDQFTASSTVSLDGVAVDDDALTFVSSQTLTIDPPQATQLGPVEVEVSDSGQTASGTVTIQAPAVPQLQLADGIVPTVVSQATGLDVLVGGAPGRLHFLIYSTSNVPSVSPQVSLDLGNNFTDVFLGATYVIPAEGWTGSNLAFTAPLFSVFYSQTVALGGGQGIAVSNLQQIITSP